MPLRALLIACLALTGAGLAAGAARADSAVYFTYDDGRALQGMDVVTYFSDSGPQPGRSEFSVMWKGAVWHFVSRGNQEAFESNPRAYAPQYGGYCAYAVSRGYTASGDPQSWRVIDGKLYLVHNPNVARMWAREMRQNIARAEANWPAVLGE